MEKPSITEKTFERPKGLEVGLRSFYFRHAEKAYSRPGEADGEVSCANISEDGKKESKALGAQLPPIARQGYKITGSEQPRTIDTGEAMAASFTTGEEARRFNNARRPELSMDLPKEFVERVMKRWKKAMSDVMNERGVTKNYDELSPKEQAELTELAEEPIIEEWLDNKDSDLARALPPEDYAAKIAMLIRRDWRRPQKLDSGSEVDLFRMTHKGVTEAALLKILFLPDGSRPRKLADIGGAFGLNEGVEFDFSTDEHGESNPTATIYRVDRSGTEPRYDKTEYELDIDELNRLADLGLAQKRKKE